MFESIDMISQTGVSVLQSIAEKEFNSCEEEFHTLEVSKMYFLFSVFLKFNTSIIKTAYLKDQLRIIPNLLLLQYTN